MKFLNEINSIKSREDFVSFVWVLLNDLKKNPDEWENRTLTEFLEAIASWVEDMEGYCINNSLPVPENVSWKVFADILVAAKMYE